MRTTFQLAPRPNSFSKVCSGVTFYTIISSSPPYNSTENVEEPKSVTAIGAWAFNHCTSLTNVTIPSSVAILGDQAFIYCASLPSVTIPAGVTYTGNETFNACSNLSSITFLGNRPTLGGSVFNGVANGATVFYYFGTTDWTTICGGLPTVMLGAPAPQISGIIGAQSKEFGFTILGVTNQTIVIEATTNLVSWQPIWTNTLFAASTNFNDPHWTNYSRRFYRARREP